MLHPDSLGAHERQQKSVAGPCEQPAVAIAPDGVWRGLNQPTPIAPPADFSDHLDEQDAEDWRAHLPPELAALLNGDIADAAAQVGPKAAAQARRRLTELVKQQAAIEAGQKKVQAQARVLRASRFVAARKLNEWDQDEAARRLGYANSTQLSLLESGSRPVRLEHVERAADVYQVSADFLLGRTSVTVELESRERTAARVLAGMQAIASGLTQAIEGTDAAMGGPTVATLRTMLARARIVVAKAARIDGPALEAVSGGAGLLLAVEDLRESVADSAAKVAAYDGEMEHLRALVARPAANSPTRG